MDTNTTEAEREAFRAGFHAALNALMAPGAPIDVGSRVYADRVASEQAAWDARSR